MKPAKIIPIYVGKCRGCGKIVAADMQPDDKELWFMARHYDVQIVAAETVTLEGCVCKKASTP